MRSEEWVAQREHERKEQAKDADLKVESDLEYYERTLDAVEVLDEELPFE